MTRIRWKNSCDGKLHFIHEDLAFFLSREGVTGGWELMIWRPDDMALPSGKGNLIKFVSAPIPFKHTAKSGRRIVERRDSREWKLPTAKRWASNQIKTYLDGAS